MENCFSEILVKSTIRNDLLKFCENGEEWIDPEVGTFLQKRPPKELIYRDPFLNHVCENCILDKGFYFSVNIFMLRPWTHYMMHSDVFRPASINLIINDFTDSISYFKITEPYNKLHIGIKELAYKRDTYYLFNSKIPHAVTNRGMPRYLLSISLKDNFDKMSEYFKNQLFL